MKKWLVIYLLVGLVVHWMLLGSQLHFDQVSTWIVVIAWPWALLYYAFWWIFLACLLAAFYFVIVRDA